MKDFVKLARQSGKLEVIASKFCGRGLFATSKINAGSVVLEETPWVTFDVDESTELAHIEEDFREQIGFLRNILLKTDFKPLEHPIIDFLYGSNTLNVSEDVREIYPLLTSTLEEESAISEKEFEELWRKVVSNCYGSSLYLARSMINHSCVAPNVLQNPSATDQFIAFVDIPPGEEIFMFYGPPSEDWMLEFEIDCKAIMEKTDVEECGCFRERDLKMMTDIKLMSALMRSIGLTDWRENFDCIQMGHNAYSEIKTKISADGHYNEDDFKKWAEFWNPTIKESLKGHGR